MAFPLSFRRAHEASGRVFSRLGQPLAGRLKVSGRTGPVAMPRGNPAEIPQFWPTSAPGDLDEAAGRNPIAGEHLRRYGRRRGHPAAASAAAATAGLDRAAYIS